MKFPISIEVIDDQIVLILLEITREFKNKINNVNRGAVWSIRSSGNPELREGTIFINGSDQSLNNKFVSIEFNQHYFDQYQRAIEHYKRELGYE